MPTDFTARNLRRNGARRDQPSTLFSQNDFDADTSILVADMVGDSVGIL